MDNNNNYIDHHDHWRHVTLAELLHALREVDWKCPPRPFLSEFLMSKYTVPKSLSKWSSSLKSNIYYYRTNYLIILSIISTIACISHGQPRLLPFIAMAISAISMALLNDSFACSSDRKIMAFITRHISPHLASKLRSRALITGKNLYRIPCQRDARAEYITRHFQTVFVCGMSRNSVVLLLSAASGILWLYVVISSMLGLGLGFKIICCGLGFVGLHSSLRAPILKTRVNIYREEFRACQLSFLDP